MTYSPDLAAHSSRTLPSDLLPITQDASTPRRFRSGGWGQSEPRKPRRHADGLRHPSLRGNRGRAAPVAAASTCASCARAVRNQTVPIRLRCWYPPSGGHVNESPVQSLTGRRGTFRQDNGKRLRPGHSSSGLPRSPGEGQEPRLARLWRFTPLSRRSPMIHKHSRTTTRVSTKKAATTTASTVPLMLMVLASREPTRAFLDEALTQGGPDLTRR